MEPTFPVQRGIDVEPMSESLRIMMEQVEVLRRLEEAEDEDDDCDVEVREVPVWERPQVAADYPEEDVDWLWPGRIPFGQITAILGPKSVGKSFLAADLIARVTNGTPWPEELEAEGGVGAAPWPGSVIVVATQDDHTKVVCPRFRRAEADMNKIVFLPYPYATVKSARPLHAHDIDGWETLANTLPDLRMIVIDPFALLLGSAIDRRTGELADILNRLGRLARERNLAVVLLNATDKVSAGKFWSHGIDALPYIRAAAQSVWEVRVDPNDVDRRQLLPVQVGLDANVGGLSFKIDPATKRVVWSAEPIMIQANQAPASRRESSGVARAMVWLQEFLADGPRLAVDVFREGTLAGHSTNALYAAKGRLHVPSSKSKDRFNGAWIWEKPAAAPQSRGRFEDAKMTTRDVRGRGEESQRGRNQRAEAEDAKMRSREVGAREERTRPKTEWDEANEAALDPNEKPLFPELNVEPPPEKPAHVREREALMREAGISNPVIWDGSDRPKGPAGSGA